MSRNDQRRRRALRAAAPIAGLLAAGLLVWQGSSAAFSATSTNGTNDWATGAITLQNNGGTATYAVGTAGLFAQSALGLGATGTKCLTVEKGGSLSGQLGLYRAAVTGTGASAGSLQDYLDLVIDVAPVSAATNVSNTPADCTNFPAVGVTNAYTGTLAAMPTTFAASTKSAVATGTQRVAYRFTWTVNTGAPAAASGVNVNTTFNFTAQ